MAGEAVFKRGRSAPWVPRSSPAVSRGWAVPGEMKYFDAERANVAIGASVDWTATEVDPATLNTLFAPVKGTGINNRIGRKVHVHKVKIR